MAANLRRTAILIVLVLTLGAIVISTAPEHRTQAGGGFPPQVLALKSDTGPAAVVHFPDSSSGIVTELQPGDRVLRTNGGIVVSDAGVYIPVYTAIGEPGWLLNGEEITEAVSAVYATDSEMQIGAALDVLAEGEGIPCRIEPTFRADTVQDLSQDDVLTIVDGPYPAELGLWWMVARTAAGSCWIYDAPGLFVFVNP